AVTAGYVRRFVVGDPLIQRVDVIAGGPVAQIEAMESLARQGQVLVSSAVAQAVRGAVELLPVAPEGPGGASRQAAQAWRVGGYLSGAAPSVARRVSASSAPGDHALSQWLLPTVHR